MFHLDIVLFCWPICGALDGIPRQMEIHQHTPYLSITVAQHLLQGTSWIGSTTTPPSPRTSNARRTASSLPIPHTLKAIVCHLSVDDVDVAGICRLADGQKQFPVYRQLAVLIGVACPVFHLKGSLRPKSAAIPPGGFHAVFHIDLRTVFSYVTLPAMLPVIFHSIAHRLPATQHSRSTLPSSAPAPSSGHPPFLLLFWRR